MAQEKLHSLYRMFDETGQLLYVGISVDPGRRLAQHRSDKPWWGEAVTISVQPMPTRAAALEAEREAIKNERPVHNTQHNTASPNEAVEAVFDYLSQWVFLGDWHRAHLAEDANGIVDEFRTEHGVSLDSRKAMILAYLIHSVGDELPDLHDGLQTLMYSFPNQWRDATRSRAIIELRRRGQVEGYAALMRRQALELAAVNSNDPSFELAPF